MTDHLEDLILTEARRQGYQPNVEAMRKAAVDLCGSSLTGQNLIHMPGKGSISPADFVHSLRNQMPEGFGSLNDDDQTTKATGNLTERMRAEIAANRKQSMPADWNQVRSRYAAGSVTAEYMDEIKRQRAANGK